MPKLILTFCICVIFSTASYSQFSFSKFADGLIDTFSGSFKFDSAGNPVSWVLAPIASYAPETSVQVGVGGVFLFRTKHALPEDRASSVFFSARYTLKHQFTTIPTYIVFTKGEKYTHRGKITFRKFPQLYYGIGNDSPASNEELYDISNIGFEHLLYRNLIDKLYVGAGFRFFRSYGLDFKEEGLLETNEPIGTHPTTAVGLNFGLLFDNRDNLISTTSGMLFEFNQLLHYKAIGSDYNYSLSKLDLRIFKALFGNIKNILAWQFYAIAGYGDIPFNELAPLGGEVIMRGYYQGRYLDKKHLASQIEYRKRITNKLSTVGFVGLGDVAPRFDAFNLKGLKYSVGAGIRYVMVPEENLNLRFDFALGKDVQNFYISVAEAF
jgi:outer membrane protein assembly factor BamA